MQHKEGDIVITKNGICIVFRGGMANFLGFNKNRGVLGADEKLAGQLTFYRESYTKIVIRSPRTEIPVGLQFVIRQE